MAGKESEFMSTIDPEYAELLAKLPPVPPPPTDIPWSWEPIRKMLASRKKIQAASSSVPQTGFTTEEIPVTGEDGYGIPVRVYKPEKPREGGTPLVVICHGGGFVVGDRDGEETNSRMFAVKLGCIVLNVEYRLAPEHPFPAGVEDSWAVLKWGASNAKSLGADTSAGFIIAGSSAGGNIAAVLALRARDEKLSPPLTGVMLLVPLTTSHQSPPEKYASELNSWKQNATAPMLGKDILDKMKDSYKPDVNSKLFNVLGAFDDYKGLPPTAFQICGLDPLRDEAIVYERVLRENGVKTKVYVYPGLPHAFWTQFPVWNRSIEFVNNTSEGVEWLLNQK